MKILLINPGTPDEIDNHIIRQIPYLYARAFNSPHAVATVAALTPEQHEVEIHDEHMRGSSEKILKDKKYDIIGISITANQLKRSLEIAENCHRLCPDAVVVAGGIGVEVLVQKNQGLFDVVFHGEAEETWPAFLVDYEKGSYQKTYKSIIKPDMTKVPAPRWELLGKDILHYNSVLLQTTRGCPFDCSFCDVIYTYGRKPRSKTIDQVLNEVRKLNELGITMVFFADDNFAGNKKYVKELLRKLIPLNNSFRVPLGFFTQLDITVAQDDELLELLADANFYNLMIGVESVSEESLKEMNKKQNIGISPVEAIKKIQSYGMSVLTHMIIGTDTDDVSVFEKTARFVQDANVVFHICHPLAAPPGTKMWYDFRKAGRLIIVDHENEGDKLDIATNIIPLKMSRVELFENLANYWETVFEYDKFVDRAIGFMNGINYKPKVKPPGFWEFWKLKKLLFGSIWYYFVAGDKKDRQAFMKIFRNVKNAYAQMPRLIYLFTFFLIDQRRSAYDARIAREMAIWERNNPDKLVMDTGVIPVSDNFRQCAPQIIHDIYEFARSRTDKRESIYDFTIRVLIEFNYRFGVNFSSYDDYLVQQLQLTCEKILSNGFIQNPSDEVLLKNPPAGFTRDIIDMLDNSIRYSDINKN